MTGMYTTGPDINHDVGFIGVPLFHIAGIGNTLGGLMLGTPPTVIHPLGGFDPGQLLDVLEAERVTGIFLVPAQWQAVCAAQKAKPRDIKLRALSWGGRPPGVGHPAAGDVGDLPGQQDSGGVRPDRDVSGDVHAPR